MNGSGNRFIGNMFNEIQSYVRSCALCQARNVAPTAEQGLTQPIPVANNVFEHVFLDLLGPLPESGCFVHIACITDKLSHMALVKPIKTQKTEEVLNVVLHRLFLRFGIPGVITADRGLNVTGDNCRQFYAMFGSGLIRTTAYHSRANRAVEAYNRVLGQTLAKYTVQGVEWHTMRPYVEFAYNTSVHESTGMTPFQVVYGTEPKLRLEGQLGFRRFIDEMPCFHMGIWERFKNIREAAKKAFESRQQVNKRHKDELPTPSQYPLLRTQ